MTLEERLTECNARSASLYLKRQSIELEIQNAQIAKVKTEQAMMTLDGEIELLKKLIEENKNG